MGPTSWSKFHEWNRVNANAHFADSYQHCANQWDVFKLPNRRLRWNVGACHISRHFGTDLRAKETIKVSWGISTFLTITLCFCGPLNVACLECLLHVHAGQRREKLFCQTSAIWKLVSHPGCFFLTLWIQAIEAIYHVELFIFRESAEKARKVRNLHQDFKDHWIHPAFWLASKEPKENSRMR